MSKRAVRRHHSARMRVHARLVIDVVQGWLPWEQYDPKWSEDRVRRKANNLADCSCWYCGNPRHSKGFHVENLTRQELKAKISFDEEIQDLVDQSDSSSF